MPSHVGGVLGSGSSGFISARMTRDPLSGGRVASRAGAARPATAAATPPAGFKTGADRPPSAARGLAATAGDRPFGP